jgi:hypothetical protein
MVCGISGGQRASKRSSKAERSLVIVIVSQPLSNPQNNVNQVRHLLQYGLPGGPSDQSQWKHLSQGLRQMR